MAEPALAVRSSATGWSELPTATVATPILAVAEAADGRIWVGGVGGVGRAGTSAASGLGLPVSALAFIGGRLIAGGTGGLSFDDGTGWRSAQTRHGRSPVTAIVAADPNEAPALIAGTLGDGIVRSTDLGRTWLPSNFGLDDRDVSALVSVPDRSGTTLLAGMTGGIYRSTTGGRTWQRCFASPEHPVAALACAPGRSEAVALLENGDILQLRDHSWARVGQAPGSADALAVLADGTVLVGSTGMGICRSTDGGSSWQITGGPDCVYCLTLTRTGIVYAGTGAGLVASADAGRRWSTVPVPPTHDLDRLLGSGGRPLLTGPMSGAVQLGPGGRWDRLPGTPFPLSSAAVTGTGALLASGPGGLFRHTAHGWRELVTGADGHLGCLSLAGRSGWAAPARHGDHVLRSRDGGISWHIVPAPFGAVPPVALHAAAGTVLAAVPDTRYGTVELWSSPDDGASWSRADRIDTPWPQVAGATLANGAAAAVGLGRTLVIRPGTRDRALDGGIRAIAGTPYEIAVLTTASLWSAGPLGTGGWRREYDGPDPADILDIGSVQDRLHLLLTGGRVVRRACHPGRDSREGDFS